MALKDNYVKGYASLGVNLTRQQYGPLDVSQVFYSIADLQHYCDRSITSNVDAYWMDKVVYPYPGQIVSVVTDNGCKVYVLVPTRFTDSSNKADSNTKYDYVEITNQKTTITGTAPISVDSNNNVTHDTSVKTGTTLAAPSLNNKMQLSISRPLFNEYGHVTGVTDTSVQLVIDDGELK